MRLFLTAALLIMVAGTTSACSEPTADTAAPATTTAVAPSPSAAAPIGNTVSMCTAVTTMMSQATLDGLGRQLGDLTTAHLMANADAVQVQTTGIRTVSGTLAAQLSEFQQRADDPALRAALGTLVTSLTTLGSQENLAGVKTLEDAGRAITPVSSSLNEVEKICG
ncbi:hypothetical protein [Actinoplanes derwentensis]|uniref:X-X-X-Leu-X-X-Gly heptad repeat-containing protein n=1 Tax=Actinoplanes derwentensis TaxID=113562 RepID=A0A1H2AXL1_9ACTN|nr:hypothetical protein [Actinoplanes derwentensis]SDT50755.1 hypothetical protein SAMN04489716_4176 [Actinoplanes derwentensis]